MTKPTSWIYMNKEERRKLAMSLLDSMRGNYIISQALYYGIRELKKEKYPEQSNIEDMEILRETIFNSYLEPSIIKEARKKLMGGKNDKRKW